MTLVTLALDAAWIVPAQTVSTQHLPITMVEQYPSGEIVERITQSVTVWRRKMKPLPPMELDDDDFIFEEADE